MSITRMFLHGLDSSGQGTKGRWFGERWPEMLRPDFFGSLDERMEQLEEICAGRENLILVGSSFGGLMSVLFASRHPERCRRLILLAPALNFEQFSAPEKAITTEAQLYIGEHDTVCPPDVVLPLAQQSLAQVAIHQLDDDHMLHQSFSGFPWRELLEFE